MRFTTLAVAFTAPFLVTAVPTKYKRQSTFDVVVLQFANLLEQLESKFYEEALAKFVAKDFTDAGIAIPDVAIQNFQAILSHETAHTEFLDGALQAVGANRISNCTFKFDDVLTDVATMATVARVVEAVGVGAYLGGATLVDDRSILSAAASILTIEARHQSFLNVLNGASGIPQPFDIALSPPQVLALAGGFISGCDLSPLQITPNDPLAITNNGTVTPGTKLTFKSRGLASADPKSLSCQMLTGGNATALSLPVDECIIPNGINGPVAIFLTTDPQPLVADITKQNAKQILSGPAIIFIDSQADALGALVRKTSKTVSSSDQLSPDQASQVLSQASGYMSTEVSAATPAAATPTYGGGYSTPPTNVGSSGYSTPPTNVGSYDSSTSPASGNSAPTNTPVPPIQVIGLSTIPA